MVNCFLLVWGYLKARFFGFTVRSNIAAHSKTFILCLDAFMMTPLSYNYVRVVNCCV